nr:recombinase family protein [Ruegeria sp. HKCCA6837]
MQRRAAIYARYSTTLQSERSIEDQVELCRRYLTSEGYREVRTFEDRAKTSETLIGRVGFANLLEAASAGEIDALVVECVDRISRDAGDLHTASWDEVERVNAEWKRQARLRYSQKFPLCWHTRLGSRQNGTKPDNRQKGQP